VSLLIAFVAVGSFVVALVREITTVRAGVSNWRNVSSLRYTGSFTESSLIAPATLADNGSERGSILSLTSRFFDESAYGSSIGKTLIARV
jgi:pantothenate kinase